MTSREAREIIADVATFWPVPALRTPTLRLWARAIEDLDHPAAMAALRALMASEPRRPENPPAAIRRFVAALDGRLAPLEDAWGIVQHAVRTIGGYGEFPSDRFPLVAQAVDRLGWLEICRSENAPAMRAHFFRVYEALLDRAHRFAAASPGAALPPAGGEHALDALRYLSGPAKSR